MFVIAFEINVKNVGWVERSDTHSDHLHHQILLGIATLHTNLRVGYRS
jgi:hypothetical protein